MSYTPTQSPPPPPPLFTHTQALKALALNRLYRKDEAAEIMEELVKADIRDENTFHAATIALRELGRRMWGTLGHFMCVHACMFACMYGRRRGKGGGGGVGGGLGTAMHSMRSTPRWVLVHWFPPQPLFTHFCFLVGFRDEQENSIKPCNPSTRFCLLLVKNYSATLRQVRYTHSTPYSHLCNPTHTQRTSSWR